MTSSRNEAWLSVWERKARSEHIPLHHVTGYDVISQATYEKLIANVFGLVTIKEKDTILEVGCGCGATLDALLKIYPRIKKYRGMDYSPRMIKMAQREFPQYNFSVGNAVDLSGYASRAYDLTFCFGVLVYLNSEIDVKRALGEILRVTKPSGIIIIGEQSDSAKKAQAEEMRKSTHNSSHVSQELDTSHLYLPKDLFEEFAIENNLEISIIDHQGFDMPSNPTIAYRYSVYFKTPT